MFSNEIKILIAVSDPQCFGHIIPKLSNEFQTQIAPSQNSFDFLRTEWEPNIIIFDTEHESIHNISNFNYHDGYGLIALDTKPKSTIEENLLSLGFDHYLSSKTSYSSIKHRIQNLFQRLFSINPPRQQKAYSKEDFFSLGSIEYFPKEHLLKHNGVRVKVSPTQLKLLDLFFKNEEQLLSRNDIKGLIWPDSNISLRSIDAQISKIKRVLPEINNHLINIYGKGYLFSTQVQKRSAS